MMSTRSSSGRKGSSSDSVVDDDILEVTQVQPENKAEEERRFARQREAILNDEMKFMADFDPDNSMRKQKKQRRKQFYPDGRPIVNADDFDICDCLEPKCPGCHFPCKSCGDGRCGHECRVNRRWIYESVEVEGTSKVYKHPHMENRYAY